jgi:hypothetical protein
VLRETRSRVRASPPAGRSWTRSFNAHAGEGEELRGWIGVGLVMNERMNIGFILFPLYILSCYLATFYPQDYQYAIFGDPRAGGAPLAWK